jgi:hypothetical protein
VNFSAKAAVTASTSIAPLARHPLFLAIERSTISLLARFAAISTFRDLAHNNRLKLTAPSGHAFYNSSGINNPGPRAKKRAPRPAA